MKKILDNSFIFFSFCFLVLMILYYPTFSGEQIWDDRYFLFDSAVRHVEFKFLDLLNIFSWPVTILTQKLLLKIFDTEYLYFHITNFCLHFINGLLLFRFLKLKNIPSPRLGFMIFLFHPSMITSVAWMIQLKTLLCAFFALLSLNYFLKSESETLWKKRYTNRAFAILSYTLSLGSKSASIPLLVYFLKIKENWKKKLYFIAPIVVISAIALYKLFTSQVALEGIQKAISSTPYESAFEFALNTVPQTLNFYFWQALFPFYNIPIRGTVPDNVMSALVGFIPMVILLVMIRKQRELKYFLFFFLMLTPFLGIIPAPFMTSSWVSDQHLYVAMIFFIPGICLLLEKIEETKVKLISQAVAVIFLCFVSFSNMSNYQDEYHFYKSSFDYNHNLAAGYQLMNFYVANERYEEARNCYYQILTSNPYTDYLENNFYWLRIQQFEPRIFED